VFGEAPSRHHELHIVHSSELMRESTGHLLKEEAECKCSFHPDADAIDHCKQCGRPVCIACAVEIEGVCFCEPCAENVKPAPSSEAAEQPAERQHEGAQPEAEILRIPRPSDALAKGPYVAWEYRHQIGRVNALFTTWLQTLFSPLRFFRSAPISGDYRSPLLYGIFWTLVGSAGGIVWKFLLYVYPTFINFLGGELIHVSVQLSKTYVLVAIALLISPLLALIMLLVACAVYHIFVALFTGRHAGFEATLRVVCYSTGTNALYFLPVVGVMLGGIWQLILVTAGLKELHRISLPMAVIITFVPFSLLLMLGTTFMLWAFSGSALLPGDPLHALTLFFSP